MEKIYLQILPVLLFTFTLISCSSSKPFIPPSYHLIKFDSKDYSQTNADEILIYSARTEISQKYVEIGTIKFEGEVEIPHLKELAAENGADALLKEGNNYILLFFLEKKEGKKDVKTI